MAGLLCRMKRRVQIIANQIVIKLSSNSFFSEFGNIFKIRHWTNVRKKTLSDRKDITKKQFSEKQLRGLKWKNKPYKLKRFIHTCISIISRKKNRYIILPLWLIFSVVPRMISGPSLLLFEPGLESWLQLHQSPVLHRSPDQANTA